MVLGTVYQARCGCGGTRASGSVLRQREGIKEFFLPSKCRLQTVHFFRFMGRKRYNLTSAGHMQTDIKVKYQWGLLFGWHWSELYGTVCSKRLLIEVQPKLKICLLFTHSCNTCMTFYPLQNAHKKRYFEEC